MTPRELLIRHEGIKLKLYKDSLGLWTIGCGRLLDPSMGGSISQDEALLMLDNDMAKAYDNCAKYPWFSGLSEPRKAAVINLMFNLGAPRFAGFKHFIAAMAAGDYGTAADELVDSKWYHQVARRGPEIVNLIRNEVWPA